MRDLILIVDDVQLNRAILRQMLVPKYDIAEVDGGEAALAFLRRTDRLPSAILLDIVMPGMDGFTVLQKIKATPEIREIPVLFISAADSAVNESRGLSAGAADYIPKPYNADVVRARLENQIQLLHYRQNLENLVEMKTNDVMKSHERLLANMATIIEHRSFESGLHIKRTRELMALLLAQMMKRPEYAAKLAALNVNAILKAVTMHDIGKVAIPDNILLKPGRLTPEEFEVVKTHTVIGGRIIDSIASELTESTVYLARCREICYSHHERWDGKGYPDGLAGEEIPLSARMLAVIDVYEALVSKRCYKDKIPHKDAVKIIAENSGTQFDPSIVAIFLEVEDKFREIIEINEMPEMIKS